MLTALVRQFFGWAFLVATEGSKWRRTGNIGGSAERRSPAAGKKGLTRLVAIMENLNDGI